MLERWLMQQNFGPIVERKAQGGGCINRAEVLTTLSGLRVFVKHNTDAPADFFAAEAAGLEALANSGAVKTPKILTASSDYLALEYLAPSPPSKQDWHKLGEQLAGLHSQAVAQFGFSSSTYCGLTPQPNPPSRNGYKFFAESRLLHQARLARDKNLLEASQCQSIEAICKRLPEWVPNQAPALVHGDLWSGNLVFTQTGPALIDPAAYWGWPEADLAMTHLFGGFTGDFYQAYAVNRKLEPGFGERKDLYNLYHLLNHLNLFGDSYRAQVSAVICQFS